MGVREFIPDIEKTFGMLCYAGEGQKVSWNMQGIRVEGRMHLFFSAADPGESMEALLLWDEGGHEIEYDEPVRLINPRVIAQKHMTETGGTGLMLFVADGMERLFDDDGEFLPDDVPEGAPEHVPDDA